MKALSSALDNSHIVVSIKANTSGRKLLQDEKHNMKPSTNWYQEYKKRRKRELRAARAWGKRYKERLLKEQKKQPRQKKTKPKYKEYIASPSWQDRKHLYYLKYGKHCLVCQSREHVDLHHTNYSRLGNERDEDLMALCRQCHEAFHKQFGVHQTMMEQSTAFLIENFRQ